MKCPECGAALHLHAEKCPNCGKTFTEEERMLMALNRHQPEEIESHEPEFDAELESQSEEHKPRTRVNTTIMIEGALCIALGVVFSKINLFHMPRRFCRL